MSIHNNYYSGLPDQKGSLAQHIPSQVIVLAKFEVTKATRNMAN